MHPPGDDRLESESLPRASARRVVVVVAVLAAVVVAGLVVSRLGGGRGHPQPPPHASTELAAPPPQPAGSDILVLGSSSGFGSQVGRRLVTVDVELVNVSSRSLAIGSPIRVSGTAGQVAVLAAATAQPGFAGLPPGVGRVGPHGSVLLFMALRVRCAPGTRRLLWPTPATTVTVPLTGVATPASYTFDYLFSRGGLLLQLAQTCRGG